MTKAMPASGAETVAFSTDLVAQAREVHQALERYIRQDDYHGWDPFDGLNSRLFRATPLNRSAFCRLAWLQLFKRLPVNFRRLAWVPKTLNAKSVALCARASGLMGDQAQERQLLDRLLALRADSERWGEAAWGYPFDWQARAFFVPQGVPNMICTTYAVRALAEAGGYDEVIQAAAQFVERELVIRREDGSLYIGYIPGKLTMVHNASLWGAYVLAEGYDAGGGDAYKELALAAMDYSLKAQRADGAWVYGEASHHQFVDGFHTGYNIEALSRSAALLGDQSMQWRVDAAVERGLAYYQAHFFEADGSPRYYDTNRWPLDCHNVAQSMITFLSIHPNEAQVALAEQVLRWVLREMWQEKRGYFAYQRTRYGMNRIPYLRWTQAWMYLALSTYLAFADHASYESSCV